VSSLRKSQAISGGRDEIDRRTAASLSLLKTGPASFSIEVVIDRATSSKTTDTRYPSTVDTVNELMGVDRLPHLACRERLGWSELETIPFRSRRASLGNQCCQPPRSVTRRRARSMSCQDVSEPRKCLASSVEGGWVPFRIVSRFTAKRCSCCRSGDK
jgi:hypothetical protein